MVYRRQARDEHCYGRRGVHCRVDKDANSPIRVGVTMSATIQRANGPSEELFPRIYVTHTYANTGLYDLGT